MTVKITKFRGSTCAIVTNRDVECKHCVKSAGSGIHHSGNTAGRTGKRIHRRIPGVCRENGGRHRTIRFFTRSVYEIAEVFDTVEGCEIRVVRGFGILVSGAGDDDQILAVDCH